MAKKIKANKTVSKALKFVDFAAIVLGLVAFFMIFVAAINIYHKSEIITSYTGWDAVFGYSETETVLGSQVTTTYLDFSFMNLLPYLLVVAGVVLLVLNCFGKGVKFLYFICAGCFIAAAVLFFLTVGMTAVHVVVTDTALGTISTPMVNLTNAFLGAGPIVSASCSILAGVACCGKIVFE